MKRSLVPLVRFVQGLRRPSKSANSRRLRARSESIDSIRIRPARLEDVPALARLHVTTFNATHLLPGGRGPTVGLRERQWREHLAGPSPKVFCFVAERSDGTLVGFASGKPADYPGFAGRLDKIYLLPHYQRMGLGRRLFGEVCRRFLADDVTSMMLFSQAENPSCRFFEALGGERLMSDTGEFHGAFGWRDVRGLAVG